MTEDYNAIDVSEDILEHTGRMGMKWYQHIFGDDPRWGKHGRTTGNKQREGTTPPKDYSEDNNQPVHEKEDTKKTVKDRYHGAHKPVALMTYQELSDSIDRMNMEKKYRDLMNDLNPKPQKKESKLEKYGNKAIDSLADVGIKIGVDFIEDGIRKSLGLKEKKDPIINLKDFRKNPEKYEGKLTNKQLKDLGDAAKAENKAKGHSDDYEEDTNLNVADFMRNPEKYRDYNFTNKDLDNIDKYGKTYKNYYGKKNENINNDNSKKDESQTRTSSDYIQEHRRKMNEAVQQYKKDHPNTKLDDNDIAENLGYTGGYISYGVYTMDKETLDFLQHVGIDTTDILTDDFLAHHGIKGMKWGVRRYQNADGTLTAAGMKRYYGSLNRSISGQRKIYASPIIRSGGASAILSGIIGGPMAALTAATVASGASFTLQALGEHGTKKADKFVLENKKAYLKTVDKNNAEIYKETGSKLFKTNFADNEKDIDIRLDGKDVILSQTVGDKHSSTTNSSAARTAAVNKYKKEHPATKLSDNEIAANLGYEV